MAFSIATISSIRSFWSGGSTGNKNNNNPGNGETPHAPTNTAPKNTMEDSFGKYGHDRLSLNLPTPKNDTQTLLFATALFGAEADVSVAIFFSLFFYRLQYFNRSPLKGKKTFVIVC
ncbi:uncharacterized protein TM35_000801040 [Trypanosoma theileri]|uniref:Uncharacterized protein n=1 Tax=Trypanosoma theileri TaxID=67003 RepID=A0A1X0NF26_9TRYP|nr:uncharacterized protein TM35_000801040 [Trypanosoma theileri]ORC82966.1 hypothetical protein TM35_000801040 [Trypanosoma theileri]